MSIVEVYTVSCFLSFFLSHIYFIIFFKLQFLINLFHFISFHVIETKMASSFINTNYAHQIFFFFFWLDIYKQMAFFYMKGDDETQPTVTFVFLLFEIWKFIVFNGNIWWKFCIYIYKFILELNTISYRTSNLFLVSSF